MATLSRALDARLGVVGGLDDTRPAAALGAEVARSLVRAVAGAVAPLIEAGYPPIVLCSAEARPVLKDLTRVDLPRLVVLSQREIPRDTPVETLGTVVEDEIPVVTSYSTAGADARLWWGSGACGNGSMNDATRKSVESFRSSIDRSSHRTLLDRSSVRVKPEARSSHGEREDLSGRDAEGGAGAGPPRPGRRAP